MELAEALLKTEQNERGGEVAQRGFDFQSCWAVSHMLEYELKGQDYVFLFEYHDDILVLDSDILPNKATFIQVKTKEKAWNLSDLINKRKNKPVSFVGKLFKHKKNFIGLQTELTFVTNAYFNFDSRNVFLANEINLKDQVNIQKKVMEQVDFGEPINLGDLTFLTSDLSL